MAESELCDLEKQYPSVKLAYPFAVESYDLAWRRFDVWNGRIQTLLALYVTVTLPIPLAGHALNMKFTSFWFLLATLAFLGTILSGVWGQLTGKLKAIDP